MPLSNNVCGHCHAGTSPPFGSRSARRDCVRRPRSCSGFPFSRNGQQSLGTRPGSRLSGVLSGRGAQYASRHVGKIVFRGRCGRTGSTTRIPAFFEHWSRRSLTISSVVSNYSKPRLNLIAAAKTIVDRIAFLRRRYGRVFEDLYGLRTALAGSRPVFVSAKIISDFPSGDWREQKRDLLLLCFTPDHHFQP
jgi:hypothetical protein